jgi:phosphoribosylanthranilate isomerase
VRVKICGLTSRGDARTAEDAGADFLGLVVSDGFGRSVAPGDAPRIVRGLSTPRVAVLVDEAPEEAARRASAIGASVLQLHGSEDRPTVEALRRLGDWTVWKAIRARGSDDVREVVAALADVVDGFLVEGWREGVVGGGGSALRVDPTGLRAALPSGRDFVLAGGLTPESVAGAVARFAPDVVDVSSGVERTVGRKDPARVRAFVRAARGARV